MDAKKFAEVLSDPELHEVYGAVVTEFEARNLEIPGFAGTVAVAETADLASAPVLERPPVHESLRDSFDTAYQTYGFMVDSVNSARAAAKGRKKPEQLKAVDGKTILADVETLLADESVMQRLEAELDYFTQNPEAGSPPVGFDLIIVPDGLKETDEQVVARGVQAKIPGGYTNPYIRPEAYNDSRVPVVTGKGYHLAFAPRHYNVPKDTAGNQTRWMKAKNQTTSTTQLQTATDAEFLAFTNGLADNGELKDSDTRFNQTYFRRFDQTPHGGYVSYGCVNDYGWLGLGRSDVRYDYSARALVVPKA